MQILKVKKLLNNDDDKQQKITIIELIEKLFTILLHSNVLLLLSVYPHFQINLFLKILLWKRFN